MIDLFNIWLKEGSSFLRSLNSTSHLFPITPTIPSKRVLLTHPSASCWPGACTELLQHNCSVHNFPHCFVLSSATILSSTVQRLDVHTQLCWSVRREALSDVFLNEMLSNDLIVPTRRILQPHYLLFCMKVSGVFPVQTGEARLDTFVLIQNRCYARSRALSLLHLLRTCVMPNLHQIKQMNYLNDRLQSLKKLLYILYLQTVTFNRCQWRLRP